MKLLPFLREDARPPEGREEVQKAKEGKKLASFGKPPEVKLSQESRQR